MANINYSSLTREVLPLLAEAPPIPLVETAIKRAVIEFCRGAWIWQDVLSAMDLVGGQAQYNLVTPADCVSVAVLAAEVNSVPIENQSILWLNSKRPGWASESGYPPRYFTQTDPGSVRLIPTPNSSAPSALVVTLAKSPSELSTDFPDWIWQSYLDALVNGAAARLMLMPGRPWSDLPNGADRRALFDSAVSNARANGVAGLSRAVIRTTSHS